MLLIICWMSLLTIILLIIQEPDWADILILNGSWSWHQCNICVVFITFYGLFYSGGECFGPKSVHSLLTRRASSADNLASPPLYGGKTDGHKLTFIVICLRLQLKIKKYECQIVYHESFNPLNTSYVMSKCSASKVHRLHGSPEGLKLRG